VALLGTLFSSIPRLVLDKVESTEAVGFYAALSSLMIVMSLFVNSLSQSITPRLAHTYQKDRFVFARHIKKLIGLSSIVVIAYLTLCFFRGRELLTLVFTSEYANYNGPFFKLMISGGILVFFSVMIIAISAQRSFRIQFLIYAACSLVTLLSSVVLIPDYGIDGAVYSSILCNSTGLVLSYLVYVRNMRKVGEQNV